MVYCQWFCLFSFGWLFLGIRPPLSPGNTGGLGKFDFYLRLRTRLLKEQARNQVVRGPDRAWVCGLFFKTFFSFILMFTTLVANINL